MRYSLAMTFAYTHKVHGRNGCFGREALFMSLDKTWAYSFRTVRFRLDNDILPGNKAFVKIADSSLYPCSVFVQVSQNTLPVSHRRDYQHGDQ